MISNFENITNPNTTPVDGDLVSFKVNVRQISTAWDYNTLIQLLDESTLGDTLTKMQFRRLFPASTNLAYDNFEVNTSISDADKAQLRVIRASFEASEIISMTDPDINGAMDFFVYLGFMTAQDKENALNLGVS